MKKLYRSRRNKKLFGLCGGLAEMLNVDATLVRILLIVVTLFTSGLVILVYILAGLVVPQDPYDHGGYGSGLNGFGSGWKDNHYGPYSGGSNYGNNQGYGQSGSSYGSNFGTPPQPGPTWQKPPAQTQAHASTNIDAMMEDLEKRALKKEIEELRAKLAKHEKGDV